MPKDNRGGFETYWTTFGQGPREALLIHCSLGHSGMWGPITKSLSGALHMTAFDLPGHGRSADWGPEAGELQGLSAAMAADLIDGPTDIIGHSFGGTVALRLAIERPDLVRSLTLIEPIFLAVAWADHPEMALQNDPHIRRFGDAIHSNNMEAAAEEFIRVWGAGPSWDSLSGEQRKYMADRMHVVAAGASAVREDVNGMLENGRIEQITAPLVLIEGDQSPASIALINEGLARRLPQAERTVIAGAGHMAPITHPDQVAAEILRLVMRTPMS